MHADSLTHEGEGARLLTFLKREVPPNQECLLLRQAMQLNMRMKLMLQTRVIAYPGFRQSNCFSVRCS